MLTGTEKISISADISLNHLFIITKSLQKCYHVYIYPLKDAYKLYIFFF